jgi:hypothetical protein
MKNNYLIKKTAFHAAKTTILCSFVLVFLLSFQVVSGQCPQLVSSSGGSVCGGGSVTLRASFTTSGAVISWYEGSTLKATGETYSPTVSSTTNYIVKATNNGCTSPSSVVTATVKTIPVITNVSSSSRCGSGSVALSASASAGTINWFSAPTGGSSLASGTSYTTSSLSSTTTYYVNATDNGCTTSSRTAVTATIKTIPTILNTTNGSHNGPGAVTLGASSSSGTTYWYSNPTGGSSIASGNSYTTPSLSSTTTYYVDATNEGCTTMSRSSVVATIY